MKNYFFISYRINIANSTPVYDQELIDKTPLEYIDFWKKIGGDYSNRIILYAHRITQQEYDKYKEVINDD